MTGELQTRGHSFSQISIKKTKKIRENIQCLNEKIGLTVLMIEQNARQGLQYSDRGYVLELGENTY